MQMNLYDCGLRLRRKADDDVLIGEVFIHVERNGAAICFHGGDGGAGTYRGVEGDGYIVCTTSIYAQFDSVRSLHVLQVEFGLSDRDIVDREASPVRRDVRLEDKRRFLCINAQTQHSFQ